jgi:hypothetical protein
MNGFTVFSEITNGSGLDNRGSVFYRIGNRIFLPAIASRPIPVFKQPPFQWVRVVLTPLVKLAIRDFDCSFPASVEADNSWSFSFSFFM